MRSGTCQIAMTKKVYKSIDLAKFIAAILVVAIHTKPFAGNVNIDYYFTSFCRLAVPFFFITTSFFFFINEKPDIKRYTKRLTILYLLWFVIELPIVYYRFFVIYDKALHIQILNFARSLVFNNTWLASWFIMACILSVNLIYYFSKWFDNKKLLAIGGVAYLISLSCSGYSGFVDLFLSEKGVRFHEILSFVFVPANSFIVAIVYVALGKIVAEWIQRGNGNLINKSCNVWLIILFFILGCFEIYLIQWSAKTNDAFMVLPFITFFILIWLLKTNLNVPTHICQYMRSMSILIYILHPLFNFLNPILFDVDFGIKLFIITFLQSLFTAFSIVILSKRFHLLKRFF